MQGGCTDFLLHQLLEKYVFEDSCRDPIFNLPECVPQPELLSEKVSRSDLQKYIKSEIPLLCGTWKPSAFLTQRNTEPERVNIN